jgi:glutathione reductase (NADPH)
VARTYDLVIIGTGTAAQGVAMRVRAAGWRVAVIDFRPFGGTCALRGCDPKKVLVAGAETIDLVSRMRRHGVTGACSINWPELMAFKRTFTDPVPEANKRQYAEKGIDAFPEHLWRRRSSATGQEYTFPTCRADNRAV